MGTYTSQQFLDRSMRCHSTTADIAYCQYPTYPPLRLCTYTTDALTQVNTLETQTCFFQIMVTLLS